MRAGPRSRRAHDVERNRLCVEVVGRFVEDSSSLGRAARARAMASQLRLAARDTEDPAFAADLGLVALRQAAHEAVGAGFHRRHG